MAARSHGAASEILPLSSVDSNLRGKNASGHTVLGSLSGALSS